MEGDIANMKPHQLFIIEEDHGFVVKVHYGDLGVKVLRLLETLDQDPHVKIIFK